MSAPLLKWAPPSPTRVAIAWLLPLTGAGGVGAKRPADGTLPYRMVTTVAGTETSDKIRQCATVSVHTFASTYDAAESAAQTTHQRMLLMGPPLVGFQKITVVNGDGSHQIVSPDSITTAQIPIWSDYQDDLIFRFVARYEIYLRFA